MTEKLIRVAPAARAVVLGQKLERVRVLAEHHQPVEEALHDAVDIEAAHRESGGKLVGRQRAGVLGWRIQALDLELRRSFVLPVEEKVPDDDHRRRRRHLQPLLAGCEFRRFDAGDDVDRPVLVRVVVGDVPLCTRCR